MRTLPPRQFTALQILAGTAAATVSLVAQGMRSDATTARNALNLLAYKDLATVHETSPKTYSITAEGREVLAAELRQEP